MGTYPKFAGIVVKTTASIMIKFIVPLTLISIAAPIIVEYFINSYEGVMRYVYSGLAIFSMLLILLINIQKAVLKASENADNFWCIFHSARCSSVVYKLFFDEIFKDEVKSSSTKREALDKINKAVDAEFADSEDITNFQKTLINGQALLDEKDRTQVIKECEEIAQKNNNE